MRDATRNLVPIGAIPATTAAVTIYTADDVYAVMTALRVTNASASPVTTTLSWYDDSATTAYHLMYQKSIAANTSEQINFENGFPLDPSDELRVTVGTTGVMHVLVNVIEIPGRSG